MVICIQHCGGCNPAIDRGGLAAALQASLAGQGHEWLLNRPAEADLVIYLSGCDADCAYRYNATNQPCVRIAGAEVDGRVVSPDELAAVVINRVKQQIAKRGEAGEP